MKSNYDQENQNKIKRYLKSLEDRIEEYDKGLDEVNERKDLLRVEIKNVDDQINQIKMDQRIIY